VSEEGIVNIVERDAQSSSSSEGDRSVRQLHNVFRVLSDPANARREQAIKLREQISSSWGKQAAQDQWFAWPTTSATPGVLRLRGVDWREQGMLSFLGYHVGETQPTPIAMRRLILEYAFEFELPPLDCRAYYLEWGAPRSAQRLNKLANTLAAFARNAKRKDTISCARAIDEWECDLAFLHERYYRGFFHFGWPDTESPN